MSYHPSIHTYIPYSLQAKYLAPIHLAIMVSDDTHDRTLELLKQNKYYGFPKEQITLMKQEKVAALNDNDARIARVSGQTYEVRHLIQAFHSFMVVHLLM